MAIDEHAPRPEHASARRRVRRVLGWTAKVLGLVLLVAVLLVGGALAYLRTDSGLAQLARLIETLVSSEQSTLTIRRLEGAFPEHLRLENVSLTDAQGTLVGLDYAELRWRPWRLLSRHLDVTTFEIGTLALNRLPAQQPAAPTPEAGPTRLPSLPLDVTLDSVRLGAGWVRVPPLLGIRASAPYLHNGSVASDWASCSWAKRSSASRRA